MKSLSLALAASLLALSAGPECTRAAAQVVAGEAAGGAQVQIAVPVVPGVEAPVAGAVSVGNVTLEPSLTLANPALVIGSPQITAGMATAERVVTAGRIAPGRNRGEVPGATPGAMGPTVDRTPAVTVTPIIGAGSDHANSPRASFDILHQGVVAVGRQKTDSGRQGELDHVFVGADVALSGSGDVLAVSDPGGRQPTLSGAPTLADLERTAVDPLKTLDERRNAVASIAKLATPEAKTALKRVGEANPEGGAADYEVHRAAYRALAEQGEVHSLRPVSAAHWQEILKGLQDDKPESAFFDYDDTLAKFREKISPEAAAALKASADAGVDTVILTDRADLKQVDEDVTIVDSLEPMTPAQKTAISVGANSGARELLFDRQGRPSLIEERLDARFTDAEKAAIEAVSPLVAEKFGRQEWGGKEELLTDLKFMRLLPIGTAAERVQEAARFMEAELASRGVRLEVHGRMSATAALPPFLGISKIDKSVGVAAMRRNLDLRLRVGDALRYGLGTRGARLLRWASGFLQARETPAAKTLVVGDAFFETRDIDADMLKGAPGARAIAVGGTADPRLDNVYVAPKKGAEASVEVLSALGGKSVDAINKKTAFGLFTQRTIGIAAFIAITIAYPFAAVPVVGWTGYGILMAFSPMAGIAAGPIAGMIIDRLPTRTAMLINTLLRAVLFLALPAFHYFGILNFWTLLIAGLADGWLLSTIMTTEGAFLKRLFPGKFVGTLNGLLMMNYLALQVILGLIVGLGRIVDKWNPFGVFMGASLINILVAGIIWLTIPNLAPPGKPAGAQAHPSAPKTPFLKRYWKEAVLFAASIGSYVFLYAPKLVMGGLAHALTTALGPLGVSAWGLAHRLDLIAGWVAHHPALATPLPVALALIFWIARTDAFKSLWKGAFANPSKEAAALTDSKRVLEAQLEALRKGSGSDEAIAAKEAELADVEAALGKEPGRMRSAMLLMALGALMMYPLQYFGLPHMAEQLIGRENKGLLLGQFLGSLFFGNLISTAAQAKLPEVRLPFLGRVAGQRLIQAGVVALAAVWVFTRFVPGSLLATAAAVSLAAGLMWLAQKVSARGWVQLVGFGFAAVWLPFLAWTFPGLLPFLTVPAAIFLSLILVGMAYGPSFVSLISYFYGNARVADMGKAAGIQGALFNAAISIGYSLLTLGAAMFMPSFPAALALLGAAYLVGGLIFWRGPRRLPGMPPGVFQKGGR